METLCTKGKNAQICGGHKADDIEHDSVVNFSTFQLSKRVSALFVFVHREKMIESHVVKMFNHNTENFKEYVNLIYHYGRNLVFAKSNFGIYEKLFEKLFTGFKKISFFCF